MHVYVCVYVYTIMKNCYQVNVAFKVGLNVVGNLSFR